MNTSTKLLAHYGTVLSIARAFEVSRETARLWLRDGIPLRRAHQVEDLTGGKIKAAAILKEKV